MEPELRNYLNIRLRRTHGFPVWQWIFGTDDAHPVAEIGRLGKIDQSRVDPQRQLSGDEPCGRNLFPETIAS